MFDYRSEYCEQWARRRLRELRSQGQVVLIEIKPKPPQIFLGGVRMPAGDGYIEPGWYHHFAVRFEGKMYDEAYPDGLPEEEYKNRFEYRHFIDFHEHP